MRIITVLTLTLLLSSSSVAQSLTINRGMYSLGGTATLPFSYDINGGAKLGMNLHPSFGYMVSDNWELTASLITEFSLIKPRLVLEKLGNLTWGAGLGFRYYFRIKESIIFYTGAEISAQVQDLIKQTIRGSITPMIGLLIPVHERIAIDMKVPIGLIFSAESIFEKVSIPMGFFGVRAFL